MEQKKTKNEKILRQPRSNRIVHWLTAISIFMLIITGLGQMPLYGRYLLVQPFGTKWLTSYELTLWVHYIFAAILIFISIYHVVYHFTQKQFSILPKKGDVKGSILIIKSMILGKEEPAGEKYLPEQRLAYIAFAFAIALAIISGFIKVIKNLIGIQPSDTVLVWVAMAHNIATVIIVLLIVAHLGAFIFKANRKLIPGIFTGYVDKNYIKERHSLWYEELKDEKKSKEMKEVN